MSICQPTVIQKRVKTVDLRNEHYSNYINLLEDSNLIKNLIKCWRMLVNAGNIPNIKPPLSTICLY